METEEKSWKEEELEKRGEFNSRMWAERVHFCSEKHAARLARERKLPPGWAAYRPGARAWIFTRTLAETSNAAQTTTETVDKITLRTTVQMASADFGPVALGRGSTWVGSWQDTSYCQKQTYLFQISRGGSAAVEAAMQGTGPGTGTFLLSRVRVGPGSAILVTIPHLVSDTRPSVTGKGSLSWFLNKL